MKLAIKLVAVLVLQTVLLLAIDGYFSVQREIGLFDTEMRHKAILVGHAMKGLVADVWKNSGYLRTMELIRDANQGERLVNIRWVWLDASPENPYGPRLSPRRLERVAHGIEMSFLGKDKNGTGYRYTYIPVLIGGDRPGAIEISEPLTHLNRYARATVVRSLVFIGVLIFVSGILALGAGVVMVGRPLDHIMEKVRRVGAGDLLNPLCLRNRDELTELAQALNGMCEHLADSREKVRKEAAARIEALEQLRHSDRLRTIGRLASGLAHELGTPLNVVSGRAGLIASGSLSTDERARCAAIIKEQTERMTTIIRQLLNFARRHPPQKTLVDLKKIAHQTLELLNPLCKKNDVKPDLSVPEDPALAMVDPDQIQQVLTNLIVNAVQALPHGGKVAVGIGSGEPDNPKTTETGYLCIYVRDEGIGISDENLSQLFEPFFSTKGVGEGTGLGLSIVRDIIEDHGGWIDVESEVGTGTCFSAYVPKERKE